MQVDTSVAEADVGKLQAGHGRRRSPSTRTRASTFKGTVRQIRNAPQTVQNVVTYDAVIDVDNPELELQPGMTANVTFVYAHRDSALRVPNAALRFQPPPELARAACGRRRRRQRAAAAAATAAAAGAAGGGAAAGRRRGRHARAARRRDRRTVWVLRGADADAGARPRRRHRRHRHRDRRRRAARGRPRRHRRRGQPAATASGQPAGGGAFRRMF